MGGGGEDVALTIHPHLHAVRDVGARGGVDDGSITDLVSRSPEVEGPRVFPADDVTPGVKPGATERPSPAASARVVWADQDLEELVIHKEQITPHLDLVEQAGVNEAVKP